MTERFFIFAGNDSDSGEKKHKRQDASSGSSKNGSPSSKSVDKEPRKTNDNKMDVEEEQSQRKHFVNGVVQENSNSVSS